MAPTSLSSTSFMVSSSRLSAAFGLGDCLRGSSSEESAVFRRFSLGEDEETEDVFRLLRAAGAYLGSDRLLFWSLAGPRLLLLLRLLLELKLGLRRLRLVSGSGLRLSLPWLRGLRSLTISARLSLRPCS